MYIIVGHHISCKQESICLRGIKSLELKRKMASSRGTGIWAHIIKQLLECYYLSIINKLLKKKSELYSDFSQFKLKKIMIKILIDCQKGLFQNLLNYLFQ